ncbi:chromosome transmission fidelity protein 18 homolog [Musca domestica]|uniref:Chromosome transmission fidelity protein 18 homolog n=1 Tax=Musca domestica TaxID=7370 RepID=A0A1I8N525_MUSDO|nr:chromosome transmission fidelity protein 18 homolog [Musca domestica]
MDQYPDENEEFELQYQEELELMDEFAEQNDFVPALPNKTIVNPAPILSQGSLNSPQLSQISFNADDSHLSSLGGGGGPVNRRLFGTPKQPPTRGASTPFVSKQKMAPIQEVLDLNGLDNEDLDMGPSTANRALEELQKANNKRKRLERDLFGDIGDLFGDDTYEDPEAKKARTEEERDLEAIEKILETRRKLREQSKAVRPDSLARLEALHAFKMRNLSYNIPQWPFLPLRRSDDERVYVRFHSEEYETKAINEIHAASGLGGLLGEHKEKIWEEANELVLKRLSSNKDGASHEHAPIVVEPVSNDDTRLWVEKYKPRKYIDLLSDEMTNRSLLYWLKMWDKVVFGKEFKALQANAANNGEMSNFNKRTGKFESNGGWRARKTKQFLNTNVDEMGRPIQKVALLCGPPGLGKTTLAHTIARHAGYNVREVNASDDRSPEAFKMALENGTQMSSVMNESKKPNCIILDEIDGAPRQSIEFLVKFVTDSVPVKGKGKGAGKGAHNILKRPIICICNDIYDPALRPLRQIAFVVTFPPIDSSRLAERLVQVAQNERMKTDFGSLIALAEKSGNDVRCCISTMQFFNAQKKGLTLQDVLNNNLGQKDRHQGLFEVWGAIFRIQRPKKQLTQAKGDEEAQVTMTDMSMSTRVRHVLDVVHSGGDYERLMQGVYENYLQQKMPDPNLNGIVEANQWFCFSDTLQRQIHQQQNYTVYPYLQYGFVIWHMLFASLAWPKINFPSKSFEFNQKQTTQKNIFQSLRKSLTCGAIGVGQGHVVLLETVPLLKKILSPQLRSVAVQLLSQKEQSDLKHCVEIMADFGITYHQVKSAEGPYIFRMEPDLDALAQFPGYTGVTLSYFGRQLVAREVELERIHRSTPKAIEQNDKSHTRTDKKPQERKPSAKPNTNATSPTNLPNHLQRLKPKRIESSKAASETVSKDFFGRIQRKTPAQKLAEEPKSDPIVKSPIWYRYKEGFNNAVRKDIHMNELL